MKGGRPHFFMGDIVGFLFYLVLRWSLYYSLSLCFLVLCISRELLKGCGSICIPLYSGNLVDQTGSSNKSLADSVWHYQEILNWIDQYFTCWIGQNWLLNLFGINLFTSVNHWLFWLDKEEFLVCLWRFDSLLGMN